MKNVALLLSGIMIGLFVGRRKHDPPEALDLDPRPDEVARVANALWQYRGGGTSTTALEQQDWLRAEELIRECRKK